MTWNNLSCYMQCAMMIKIKATSGLVIGISCKTAIFWELVSLSMLKVHQLHIISGVDTCGVLSLLRSILFVFIFFKCRNYVIFHVSKFSKYLFRNHWVDAPAGGPEVLDGIYQPSCQACPTWSVSHCVTEIHSICLKF